MKNTYALLIGINDYPSPIPKLNGCLKDLDRVEEYLRTYVGNGEEAVHHKEGFSIRQYGSLHLCRLENDQATYHNIIHTFRLFLCQAGPNDVAWLHYSGHGSEAFTADEFLAIEPNGKDQTLVCYRSHESDGQLHLADKELAVLLHEVATQDVNGNPKESPHLVVSMDCCHSGSATRDMEEEVKTRGLDIDEPEVLTTRIKVRTKGIRGRSLNTYLDYYQQQWDSQQNLEVPAAPHILLSACKSIEKAGEVSGGGMFTKGLIEALTTAQGQLSYADLFVRARATTRRLRHEQTPQFETVGHFDPYTCFLDGSKMGSPECYEVKFEDGQWLVKCGAIQGLPLKAKAPIQLEIQTPAPENKTVAQAIISGIGAQKSHFTLTGNGTLDKKQDYQALIRFLPAPAVMVYLHGDVQGVDLLKKHWDTSRNVQWTEAPTDAALEVEANNAQYFLRDRRSNHLALTCPMDVDNAKLILQSLGKIVRWERTIPLDNDRSGIRNDLDFELQVMGTDRKKVPYQGDHIELLVSPEKYFSNPSNGALGAFFYPQLTIRKTDRALFAYLFHLRANYGIDAYEGEVAFRPVEHPGKQEVILPLWKKNWGWGLSADEQSSTSYFKVIVTTQPLDYQQLLQAPLGGDRADIIWQAIQVEEDWCSITVKVTMKRR